MLNKRGNDHFNLSTISFLTVVILLILFSVFYGSWYHSNITGFQTAPVAPTPDSSSFTGPPPAEIPPGERSSSGSSTQLPPLEVISEISQNARVVSQNADYASSIEKILTSPPLPSEDDLFRFNGRLMEVRDGSYALYKKSFETSGDYRSQELDFLLESMVINIAIIERVIELLDSIIDKTGGVDNEEEREWQKEREEIVENSKELIRKDIDNLIPSPPSDSELEGLSPDDKTGECIPLTYSIAVKEDVVDLGNLGYNSNSGKACDIEPANIYLRPALLSPAPPSGTDRITEAKEENVWTLYFSKRGSGSSSGGGIYEAVTINRQNANDLLTFTFFASPSYFDFESQINNFINELFYGENKNPNSLIGLSVEQTEQIVSESKQVPWILWRILLAMIILFVFFSDLLLPLHKKLIYYGKIALNKKNYSRAIENYNRLANTYSRNIEVKQEILNYLKLIEEKIGKSKINLELHGKNLLPTIKTAHLGVLSNYYRVESMIQHALHDLNKSPKLAKARIPIIVEEYKMLDKKEKERLAPKYESLIYKLKHLN